jgi:hypothetical protein
MLIGSPPPDGSKRVVLKIREKMEKRFLATNNKLDIIVLISSHPNRIITEKEV